MKVTSPIGELPFVVHGPPELRAELRLSLSDPRGLGANPAVSVGGVELGVEVESFQTNSEGAMAERISRFIEGGDRFVLGQISVAGEVMLVEELGADALLHVRLAEDHNMVIARTESCAPSTVLRVKVAGKQQVAPARFVRFQPITCMPRLLPS